MAIYNVTWAERVTYTANVEVEGEPTQASIIDAALSLPNDKIEIIDSDGIDDVDWDIVTTT